MKEFFRGPSQQFKRTGSWDEELPHLEREPLGPAHIRVDDRDVMPTEREDAADLGRGSIRTFKVLHHSHGNDQVERVIREGKLLRSRHGKRSA